jgi:PucR family transcriptional regulator, proline-responsive transcriptional activator
MALTIQTLFDATAPQYRLKLLAGRTGMYHPVSWMYYTEDTSTIDFIRGSELILTTGMNCRTRSVTEYLTELIEKLRTLGASGLIINIGRYIDSVPATIQTYCDTIGFPLFSLPWEIHLIDIMQDYGNRIVSERHKHASLAQSLYDCIFKPESVTPQQLSNTAFSGTGAYAVIILELPDELFRKSDEELARYMDYSFNGKLALNPASFCWFVHNHKIIYIVNEHAGLIAKNMHRICMADHYFRTMKIAVSGTCSSARQLQHEYHHAKLALRFCGSDQDVSLYQDLGIFKLLGEIPDTTVLEQFAADMLGKLSIFPPDKRSDYLKTLRLYLENNGNVNRTAAENKTHRNTVNYRIRKVQEILNADMQDGKTRCMLLTAVYILELLDRTH